MKCHKSYKKTSSNGLVITNLLALNLYKQVKSHIIIIGLNLYKRGISVKEIKNYYDLSYPQLGVWHLEKLYPNTSIGNLSATLRIEKNLDFSLMDKAMNYIIQKNDALRISLSEIDGEPKQYVVPYKYKKIDIFDV